MSQQQAVIIAELQKQQQQLEQLYQATSNELSTIKTKLAAPRTEFEKKGGWQLNRPKDMEPNHFSGKDEEWSKWKEEIEDFMDAVHPGLKWTMAASSKLLERIDATSCEKDGNEHALFPGGSGGEMWLRASEVFALLKRKTSV